MDKELFNGTPVTNIDDAENISLGQPGQEGSKVISWANFKTLLTTLFVRLTGNQTIAGIKAFVSSPTVPNPSTSLQAVNLQTLLQYTNVDKTVQIVTSSLINPQPDVIYLFDCSAEPLSVTMPG